MHDHTLFMSANHQSHIKPQKMGSQSGDCRWPVKYSSGKYGLVYSLHHLEAFSFHFPKQYLAAAKHCLLISGLQYCNTPKWENNVLWPDIAPIVSCDFLSILALHNSLVYQQTEAHLQSKSVYQGWVQLVDVESRNQNSVCLRKSLYNKRVKGT